MSEQRVSFENNIPSYHKLFPSPSTSTSPKNPSVLSPEAYFTDLMRIIDEYITEPSKSNIPEGLSLIERRADLWDIKLDQDDTYTQIPYITIVNQVLEKKLQADVGNENIPQYCSTASYPFNLPKNIPLGRIRSNLENFHTSLDKIYTYLRVDSVDVAREFLNLSIERYAFITTENTTDNDITVCYGLYDGENTGTDGSVSGLSSQALFCKKTSLTTDKLEELIFQNTRQDERVLLDSLFINKQLNGEYVTTEKTLLQIYVTEDSQQNLNIATLDILQRFIRLARSLQWSFPDLDWCLCSLGFSTLDTSNDNALAKKLAQLKRLHDHYQMPLDILCSFFSDIKTIGMGKDGPSKTLFDKIFNQPQFFNGEPQPYHPNYTLNSLYQSTILNWDYTSTSDNNNQLFSSLTGCLKLQSQELTSIVDYLIRYDGFTSVTETSIPLSVENLSVLYRYSQLPKMLNLSVKDFLSWLVLIGKPLINSLTDVIEICEYSEWLKKSQLSPRTIAYLIFGLEHDPAKDSVLEKIDNFFTNLQQRVQGCLLKPISFIDSDATRAQSLEIFQQLVTMEIINGDGVVLMPLWKRQVEHYLETAFPDKNIAAIGSVINSAQQQQNALIQQCLSNLYQASQSDVTSACTLVEKRYPSHLNCNGTDVGFGISCDSALCPDIFSVTGWFSTTDPNQEQCIVSCISSNNGYALYVNSGILVFQIGNSAPVSIQYQGSDSNIEENTWYYFALTYSNGTFQFFLNDIAQDSYSLSNLMENDITKLTLACDTDQSHFLSGKLAQIRIFDNALSQNDANADMASFFAPNDNEMQSLLGWWPLSDGFYQPAPGTEMITVDASGNGYEALFLGEQTENIWDNCYLSNLLIASNLVTTQQQDILFSLSRSVAFVKSLQMTTVEMESFIKNPSIFEIQGINPLEKLTLNNIVTIVDFHYLVNSFSDTQNVLLQYLDDPSSATSKDKVLLLSRLTNWASSEIEELEGACDPQTNLSLWPQSPDEYFNTIEGIIALKSVFDVKKALGVDISFLLYLRKLHNLSSSDNWEIYQQAAQMTEQVSKASLSAKEQEKLYATLSEKKRDLLSKLLIWTSGKKFLGIENEQDLFEFLLIDVQMASNVEISYLKEGLNALQLYANRVQNNLETGVISRVPHVWWSWIGSYRVWQVNRELYLNPENYVDPTLRQFQSSYFKTFSDQLIQNKLSEENITQAYLGYLHSLTETANLKIVDSYCIDVSNNFPDSTEDKTTRCIFLFGCTRSEPSTFYYRSGLIVTDASNPSVDDSNISWTPWKKIDLSINSHYITPIYAFGKLFVFWVEQTQKKISSDGSSSNIAVTTAKIKYAFEKVNKGWSQAQNFCEFIINVTKDNQTEAPAGFHITGFDANSSYEETKQWNKVSLFLTPNEEIAVTLGDWIQYNSSFSITGATPGTTKEEIVFSKMLQQAYLNAQTVAPNHTTLVPIMTIDASLVTEQKVANATIEKSSAFCVGFDYLSLVNYSSTSAYEYVLSNLSGLNANIETVKNHSAWYTLNTGKEAFLLVAPGQNELLSIESSSSQILIDLQFSVQRNSRFQFIRLSTNIIENLQQLIFAGGIDNMLKLSSQLLKEYDFTNYIPNLSLVIAPKVETMNFNGSYGIYFWELFFYAPWLIAKNLSAQQQFSYAQNWYNYIFSPAPNQDKIPSSYWPLDEKSSYFKSNGLYLEDSTGDNNGRYVNTTTNNVLSTNVLPHFDGSSWIEIPYNKQLNSPVFSVSAWVYLDDVAVTGMNYNCVYCSRVTGYMGYCIYYNNTDGSQEFSLWLGNGSNKWNVVGGSDSKYTESNQWIFIAAVYDGTTGYIYVNQEATSQSFPLAINDTENAFIGKPNADNYYFNGYIANLAVYDKALNAQQIAELYKRNDVFYFNDPAAYWSLQKSTCSYANYSITTSINTIMADVAGGNDGVFYNPSFSEINSVNRPNFTGNNYIEVPYNEELNPPVFSVSVWVYLDDTAVNTNAYNCVYCSRKTNYTGFCIYYNDTDGGQEFALWLGNGSNKWNVVKGMNSVYTKSNQWIFVTAVYDGETGYIYVNQKVTSESFPLVINGTESTLIGKPNADNYYFNGYIANLVVYNRALSSEEVINMYYNKAQIDKGVVAYWPLQDLSSVDIPSTQNGIICNDLISSNNGYVKDLNFVTKSNFCYFDGATYIETPYQSPSTFSVSAWVYPTQNTQNILYPIYCLMQKSYSGYSFRIQNNKAEFYQGYANQGGSQQNWFASKEDVNINEWTFLVFTFDGQTSSIYINGAIDKSDNQYQPDIPSSGEPTIGSNYVNDKFVGYLKEITLYDSALDENQISDLYQSGDYSGAISYWPLYENTSIISGNTTTFQDVNSFQNGTADSTHFFGPQNNLSVYFDGHTQVKIANDESLSNKRFTQTLWMYPTASPANDGYFYLYASYNSDNATGYSIAYHEKKVLFQIGNDHIQSLEYSLNQWYFVCALYDGKNALLYVNGKLCASKSVTYTPRKADDGYDSCIGGYGGNETLKDEESTYSFQGYIKNVAIYDTVFSCQEINALYVTLKESIGYNIPQVKDKHCWQFAPFYANLHQSKYENLTDNLQILVYEYDPFQPDAVAYLRKETYQKAIVLDYIKNLIDDGDYLFAQDTWETLTEATLDYTLAKEIIGEIPNARIVDIEPAATYNDIIAEYGEDNVPQFLIDLSGSENVSYSALPIAWQGALQNWLSVNNAYFWVPDNKQIAIYQKTISDRLYKIHHGLNIEGQQAQPALFEPPLDPTQMINTSLSSNITTTQSSSSSIPPYRFSVIIEHAKSIAQQASSLGNALLVALEKKDAEELAQLNATNQTQIYNLTTKIKADQINQLQYNRRGLEASLANATLQQQTYKKWLKTGLSKREITAQATLVEALVFMSASNLISYAASPLYLFPTIFGLADGGVNIGGSFEALSRSYAETANIMATSSQLCSMMGQFERRDDEWNLQWQSASNSVKEITAQLEANECALEIAQQDYDINQTQIQFSQSIENYLTSKFTNEELYEWMANQLSTLYYQAYQIACDIALLAQKAYQFELSNSDSFVDTNSWNSENKGLLAADTLLSSLNQLDQAYIQNNRRKLEIEKTISLLHHNPHALSNLKQYGSCCFKLEEINFDLDFPGHYNRQIKSVSISIPAIVGPYQNIHATLTQTCNQILLTPSITGVEYLLTLNSNTQQSIPPEVRTDWSPNQEIALSKGVDDSGLFVLNFNDERYLPFEGTGAISQWQFDMPKASNQIDFNSISDVIIKINYTADDGGSDFRNSVIGIDIGDDNNSFCPLQTYYGFKSLSLKQTFGNSWHSFATMPTDETYSLPFSLIARMFPPNIDNIQLGLNGEISLLPVFNEAITQKIINGEISYPTIYLISDSVSNSWDSTDNSVAIATPENLVFPLNWKLQASDIAPELLTAQNSINTALWLDVVLSIPYNGSLDWGNNNGS